jgi:hypothetical protein
MAGPPERVRAWMTAHPAPAAVAEIARGADVTQVAVTTYLGLVADAGRLETSGRPGSPLYRLTPPADFEEMLAASSGTPLDEALAALRLIAETAGIFPETCDARSIAEVGEIIADWCRRARTVSCGEAVTYSGAGGAGMSGGPGGGAAGAGGAELDAQARAALPPDLFVSWPDQPVRDMSDRPVPPEDLSLTERHRWVCRWALTVQARTLAPLSDLRFHGTPAGPGCDVAIESRGRFIGELANTGYMHSPTGFGAGYEGSGAAALASSLLVATLGAYAACQGCAGSGKVTYLAGAPVDADPVPWLPEHDQMDDETSAVDKCHACDGDGIRVPRSLYQRFKQEVVSRLPGDAEWFLPRAGVLDWLRAQVEVPALASAAREISQ